MPLAILQVADQGPLESLAYMLESAGIHCLIPSKSLLSHLRDLGCDTVLNPSDLHRQYGYEFPTLISGRAFPEAGLSHLEQRDVLYFDVKAHRNGPKIWKRYKSLQSRTCWYRINGGKPEHVYKPCGRCFGAGQIRVNKDGVEAHEPLRYTDQLVPCPSCKGGKEFDHGNELDPPCPILTPNQWYKDRCLLEPMCRSCHDDKPIEQCPACYYGDNIGCSFDEKECPQWSCHNARTPAYVCWPPFLRESSYYPKHNRYSTYDPPVCLIHNINGWGYGALVEPFRSMFSLRCFGTGSPDGLIDHTLVPKLLATSIAMIHLKSSDAPGYAIYESLAAACPVICTRRLIWRCQMQDLLIPNETCLVFDRETHDPLTDEDVAACLSEVSSHLLALSSSSENARIGLAGRDQFLKTMWSKGRDLTNFKSWLRRTFDVCANI